MSAYRETSPLAQAAVLLQRLSAAKRLRVELEAELERKLRPRRLRRRLVALGAIVLLGAAGAAAHAYEPQKSATVVVPVRGACHDAYTPLEIVVAECEGEIIRPDARAPGHRGFAFRVPAGPTCRFRLAYENGDGTLDLRQQVGAPRSYLELPSPSVYVERAVADQETACDAVP